MSDRPLALALAIFMLLDSQHPMTEAERKEALDAAEKLVLHVDSQTRGLRKRRLSAADLAESRSKVAEYYAHLRGRNPNVSMRSACRWIAVNADLPPGRVQRHLREMRTQNGKHVRVSHSRRGGMKSTKPETAIEDLQ